MDLIKVAIHLHYYFITTAKACENKINRQRYIFFSRNMQKYTKHIDAEEKEDADACLTVRMR